MPRSASWFESTSSPPSSQTRFSGKWPRRLHIRPPTRFWPSKTRTGTPGLVQAVGGGQPGDPGAHHRDLARRRRLGGLPLGPELAHLAAAERRPGHDRAGGAEEAPARDPRRPSAVEALDDFGGGLAGAQRDASEIEAAAQVAEEGRPGHREDLLAVGRGCGACRVRAPESIRAGGGLQPAQRRGARRTHLPVRLWRDETADISCAEFEPGSRQSSRSLRDRRAARRRRDGRGLPRPRHPAGPRRGAQGAAARAGGRPRPAAPLRAGGAGGERAQSSQHPGAPRPRDRRRHALPGDRAARRRDACAPGSRAVRRRCAGRSTGRARSPRASPPRTRAASCTATSSRRTSSSTPTGASRSSTSASPS